MGGTGEEGHLTITNHAYIHTYRHTDTHTERSTSLRSQGHNGHNRPLTPSGPEAHHVGPHGPLHAAAAALVPTRQTAVALPHLNSVALAVQWKSRPAHTFPNEGHPPACRKLVTSIPL